jgi:release factor glutamine methyltransferase
MHTIAEAVTKGAELLRASGVYEERRTAGALLCHTLGIDRAHLLTRSNEQIDEPRYQAYLSFVERRAAGEPLQYITGHQEFYGLDFIVTRDVLIPRPETEFLVERVIKLARDIQPRAPEPHGEPELAGEPETRCERAPLIVDVGTGSGCIAVTLAACIPAARVIATDISAAALKVASENAERHNVQDRIEFIQGDLLEPLAGQAKGSQGFEAAVDFLASNPPYVEEATRETIQREVRDWEPTLALYGGADGLNCYRRLLAEGTRYLKSGGYLVCEIGYGQLNAIREMIDVNRWKLVDIIHDLQGIPRTLAIRKI